MGRHGNDERALQEYKRPCKRQRQPVETNKKVLHEGLKDMLKEKHEEERAAAWAWLPW